MKTQCEATTRAGTSCKAWAVPDSDPPRCAAHGGASAPPGAPLGNQNARTHGFYADTANTTAEIPDIDQIIADLYARQKTISSFLAAPDEGKTIAELTGIFAIHAQNASRLGRLLRDKRALSGDAADGIAGALAQALDELSIEWGVKL